VLEGLFFGVIVEGAGVEGGLGVFVVEELLFDLAVAGGKEALRVGGL
jgi:hypothetical protein